LTEENSFEDISIMKPYKLVLSKYPRIALKIVRASTPEIKHAPIKVAQEITKAMKSLLINELYYW